MLILTRRPRQEICIGESVKVTVLSVIGNKVRLGIEAPRSVVVDREEIARRKRREQKGASHEPPSSDAASGCESTTASKPQSKARASRGRPPT